MSGPLLGRDLGGAEDGRGGVEADGGDSLGYSHHMQLPAWDKPGPSWSGYLRCTELPPQTTKYTVCPSAWLCSAALLYLNTGSNIETKGQMSGPKPEPASGGGYGWLGLHGSPAPAVRGLHTEQGQAGAELTQMLGVITVSHKILMFPTRRCAAPEQDLPTPSL